MDLEKQEGSWESVARGRSIQWEMIFLGLGVYLGLAGPLSKVLSRRRALFCLKSMIPPFPKAALLKALNHLFKTSAVLLH